MSNQLYKKLAAQIMHDYAAAESLPGERILAERYACTRSTIRAALGELNFSGTLISTPRHGHKLLKSESKEPSRHAWNIVMFTSRDNLYDQNFLDFMAGVTQQSRIRGLNLIVREIDGSLEANSAASLEQFHPGIRADGYIMAKCASERLLGFLENVLKPCVILGEAFFAPPEKRRFFQVCLPLGEKYAFVFKKLMDLGHRRFLTVSREGGPVLQVAERLFNGGGGDGASMDVVMADRPGDASAPCIELGRKVADSVKDHTALVVPFGGAASLSIYRCLVEKGIRMPERLSLVVDSGRYDYFVNVYGIDNVFSSAWEEGVSCVDEIESQLRTGSLRFGSKTSHYQYIEGGTVAQPGFPPPAGEGKGA